MNDRSSSVPRWLKLLLWASGLFVFGLVVTAVWVWRSIHLSPEARSLQAAVASSLGQTPQVRVQLSVGSVLLCTARGVVHYIEDVPPEAREALRAVRSASVGVFELPDAPVVSVDVLQRADRVMARQGWHRIVGVRDGKTTVLVYTPEKEGRARDLEVCLAVVDGTDFVVVSGRIDGRALVPLVHEHLGELVAQR